MKNTKFRNSFLLLLTAFIWGVAFVAQSAGGDAVGPYTFNCVRMILGGISLLPVIVIMDHVKPSTRRPVTREQRKELLLGGVSCGAILFVASSFQQMGIYLGTSAGKAGFLTACYILLVPLIGLFFHKKCRWNLWAGVALAVLGLYLNCMSGPFLMQLSYELVLLCAPCFSFHIIVVDHFAPKVDGVRMSCIQFFTCGILGSFPAVLVEMGHTQESVRLWLSGFAAWDAWITILYAAILSCGVAYTLQIIGQEGLHPTVASLLMSLESVFSVIAGWVLLKEDMSPRELAGCMIMFAAIILAQLEVDRKWQEK